MFSCTLINFTALVTHKIRWR